MQDTKKRQAWIKSRRKKRKSARHTRTRQQFFRYFMMLFVISATVVAYSQTKWHLDDIEKDIAITGNYFTPKEKIRDILAQSLYVPVYQIDPEKLEREVKKLESIKYVFVRRYAFPRPKLVVKVKEKFPFASLSQSPEIPPQYVITESGSLVPVSKFPSYPRPALRIVANLNSMKKFTSQDVKQWGKWIAYIEKQTDETVKTVDLREKFDAKITTNKTLLKLGLPDTTLTNRLSRISSIWHLVEQYRDQLEYVDLALDNNIPLKVSEELKKKNAILAKKLKEEKRKEQKEIKEEDKQEETL